MSHKHHKKSGRPMTEDLPMEDTETGAGEISIAARSLTIGSILDQMRSIRENAASFLHTPPEPDEDDIWTADIEAVDAASAILSALQEEGIGNAEQVKDLLFDYGLANKQLQAMHEKYEKKALPKMDENGQRCLCPSCNWKLHAHAFYCHHCGKRINTLFCAGGKKA